MPIPAFESIRNILPPHLGDPRQPHHLSPYACTVEEICDRFATSQPRKQILEGFLNLREELLSAGLRGVQWVGGSFVEEIEIQERRPPKDIDVVTFIAEPLLPADIHAALAGKRELLDRNHVKSTYHTDHFLQPLGSKAWLLVQSSKYWYGLFSHRRDREWKGMLVTPLVDLADNQAGRQRLSLK